MITTIILFCHILNKPDSIEVQCECPGLVQGLNVADTVPHVVSFGYMYSHNTYGMVEVWFGSAQDAR